MIIHNKADRFLFVAGRRLFPGVNVIPDAEWPAVKAVLGARVGVDVGVVAVKTTKAEDGTVTETGVPFSKVPTAEAEALVKKCLSTEQLEEWRKTEGRDSVRAAISNWLEYLRKPEKKEKKEQE